MSTRTMSIVEFNGQQIYKSDYTFAESIALLEIWKAKLIQEKIAAQDKGSGAAQTAPNNWPLIKGGAMLCQNKYSKAT